ncbi:MAG TPA: YdcF family protein [Stellaceae bacterium]|nr:YdcF family protein [Stellaceae bacterium]
MRASDNGRLVEELVSFGFLALPTVFITLCLIGAVVAAAGWRGGIALALASSVCLYVAATPGFSAFLLQRIESRLPRAVDLHPAQAIVVLGGDVKPGNGRDIPDRLGRLSLERLIFAADAYHRLHLPVAVSGGLIEGAHTSEAALMQKALEDEFAVPVKWTEDRSRSTWENAAFTARLLRPAGITRIVLVSQAWHLPRAIWAFRQAGMTALPWLVPRAAPQFDQTSDFLPSPTGLTRTFLALHEMIGGIYYRLRY